MCGNCRLCADTVLFRNVYFVLKLRILFGNYDLSERLLCAFVRSCGAWTVSTVLLAADIFTVLMFLVLDCFIVQVFLLCRRLFWTLSLTCCLLFLTLLLVCAAAELCSATQGAALHLQGVWMLEKHPPL